MINYPSTQLVHIHKVFLYAIIIDVVADFDIKFAEVRQRFPVCNAAVNCVTPLRSNVLLQIENSLLPVSALRVRRGRKSYWIMKSAEIRIPPSDHTVHSFIKFHLKLVLRGKFNVASFHCAQINFLNLNSVGYDHVTAHNVDEWLSHDGWR